LVLASIVGLWATYFLLVTLRGAVLGFDFSWALVSRRVVVTLLAMALTTAIWPLLIWSERRPFWQRAGLVMVVAMPAAILVTTFNNWIFADLEESAAAHKMHDVSILQGDKGDVVEIGKDRVRVLGDDGSVVELSGGRVVVRNGNGRQPSPPSGSPPPPSASPRPHPAPQPQAKPMEDKGFWENNADLVLGRYFLLLAWAAIYLALANAEQARAAERREGEHRRAAQAAELRSLRYQINPHFLFNTLNSLSALVLTGKREGAERMIQTLSTFYRRSLSGDTTGDVPLDEEIELQRLYLEIEAVRFPERLRTVVNVPIALSRASVPGMILQPLVENSIKYGVAVSRNPVTVTIAARAEGETLVLSVSDDGPGGAVQDGCGIGLANVRDRLHARFDGKASLQAGPRAGGGFETVIRLPLEHG
jgi:hypothetical protein